jgi:hypothetical protein
MRQATWVFMIQQQRRHSSQMNGQVDLSLPMTGRNIHDQKGVHAVWEYYECYNWGFIHSGGTGVMLEQTEQDVRKWSSTKFLYGKESNEWNNFQEGKLKWRGLFVASLLFVSLLFSFCPFLCFFKDDCTLVGLIQYRRKYKDILTMAMYEVIMTVP